MADSQPRALPRFSLATVALLHAGVFVWGGTVLPWESLSALGTVFLVLGVANGVTAGVAAARLSVLNKIWLASSVFSLLAFAWSAWQIVDAAAYVAAIYGSLGEGIGASLLAAVGLLAMLTVPLSCWGLACTWPRGKTADKRSAAAAGGIVLLACGSAGFTMQQAKADAAPGPGPGSHSEFDAELAAALAPEVSPEANDDAIRPPRAKASKPRSLFSEAPAQCAEAPGGDLATALVFFHDGEVVQARCVQSEAESLAAEIGELLQAEQVSGRVKVDVVRGVQVMPEPSWLTESFAVRPGLDGLCNASGACLAPWQLSAIDAFTTHTPLKFLYDFRLGVDPVDLRRRLGEDASEHATIEGLLRVETRSLLVEPDGRVVHMPRQRLESVPLDAEHLERARSTAERHIARAQKKSGQFRYTLDPHTGDKSYKKWNLPRQAGTTLAMCELGAAKKRTLKVAKRSLGFMARRARIQGDMAALTKRKRSRHAGLGPTALPMLAFLTCRQRVGGEHDELIVQMANFLMHMQRPDGGFYPRYSLEEGHVVEGPDPLYAVGQATYALVLLEKLAEEEPELGLPPAEDIRLAADRAMNYTATAYWDHALKPFFYMEENWHCLGARAGLGYHRNDAYERFCLDYIEFKSRFVLDEGSRVDPDFVGGYGFGNIIVPHNTGSAGFGEGLAAAIAIKRARDESTEIEEQRMRQLLKFLLRQQWSVDNCFACARGVVGAFSETNVSPVIRIDFVQHAFAAMGHGGATLGL